MNNCLFLGDVITLEYGRSLPTALRRPGKVPVYGSNGITGWHDHALIEGPVIIIGRKGSIGEVQYEPGSAFPIDTTYYAVPKPGVSLDFRYLYYMLRAARLTDLNSATGVPGLNRDHAYRVPARLPLLDEQRRAVAVLDRAAEIRHRADAARAKARAVIPALFLDIFGDPATNLKGWPVGPLGNHISLVGGGTPSKTRPELWDGDIPWISPKDMKPAIISASEDKITKAAMIASPVRLIPPGNVLMVVRGMILAHTVPIRMNSIAVTLNQDMKALVPDPSFNATFLRWLLQSAHGYLLGKVRESAHGTKKLETAILTTFPTMLPPVPLQVAFAEQAHRLESLARHLDAAAAKADAIATGLSAEVFGSPSHGQ